MKRTFSTELAYVFGIVFVALGVVLMKKADFGASMVVAPAYLLYRWLSPVWSFVTFGMAEYCLQAVLLLAMCLLLRFRVSYLFSFVTAVVYGFALDAFMLLGAALPAGSVWLRVIYYALGMFFCAAGVSAMFHTYSNESQVEMMGGMQKWASTYPLFHWGPIAWGFYIVLAVAFGFMIHIRGRDKQKFSEACRPLLGSRVDGVLGRVIDLTAIFALIAGTATTFSLATPLLSRAISHVFGLQDSIGLTIAILLMIAAVYTFTVWFGMKGIAKLAAICSYCFFALLAYVLFGGGETRYILETGFSAIGNLVQNFIGLSTWMDPLRETSFPQNWTIYYWAYWMVWCVATPFFIGVISKGRTIRNTILGGYGWGLAGTFTSFIILGNYGLAQQLKHGLDITGFVAAGGDYSEAIMKIFDTLPLTEVGLILLAVTMIAFYSTTFDALTMVVSSYSYKRLKPEQEPDKRVRTFWAVVFILLPIALIFSENSMHSLQSVSIIAAFPIGIIILIIVASFFRDASGYLQERKDTQA